MSEKPIHFASDVHLGAVPPETERAFIRWLTYTADHASELVLNGDLFDFWFEYRSVIPGGHARALGALAELVDSGLPVTLMGGNHDWWAGRFLSDDIGLTLEPNPVVRDLAGLRTLVAHGDGLGRADLPYRILKAGLRSRSARWFFRWLHPDMGATLASRISRTKARLTGPSTAEEARSNLLYDWAVEKLAAEGDLDLIVLGHAHIPLLHEAGPGRFYVNLGDWIYHRSFLVLTEGKRPSLQTWGTDGAEPL
jgi:UDP-2,3-diacylglucosamine hydrolase